MTTKDDPNHVILFEEFHQDALYKRQLGERGAENSWLYYLTIVIDTLITWTDDSATDMALIFEDSTDCSEIWWASTEDDCKTI